MRALLGSIALHSAAAAVLLAVAAGGDRATSTDGLVLPELMGRRGAGTFEAGIRLEAARGPAVERAALVEPGAAAPEQREAEEDPEPASALDALPFTDDHGRDLELEHETNAASGAKAALGAAAGGRRFVGKRSLARPTEAAPAPGFATVRPADLPAPVYPRSCLILRHQGLVMIDVRVGVKGEVLEAKVAERSCCPSLDEAALEAVRAARYVPGRRWGVPAQMTIRQPIRFELPK